MKKRKIVSLALALTLSSGLFSGCGKQTQAFVSGDPNTIVITDREAYLASNGIDYDNDNTNIIDSFEVAPESKEYDVGEHLIMIRYNLFDNLGYESAQDINSLSISVPDGYEVFSIENFNGLDNKIGVGQTYGLDIWFINNKKVLVVPIYNEAFKYYDYSHFGIVIELEEDNVLEDNDEIKLEKKK